MTTVDDKLKLFTRIVLEKVQKDSEQKVLDFKSSRDMNLEEQRKNTLKASESIISQAKKRAELKKNQIVTKAGTDGQREILKCRKEIFDRTVGDLKTMAEEYTAKPEYAGYLEKCIGTVLSKIDSGEVYLFLTERDMDNYRDKIEESVNRHKRPDIKVKVRKAPGNIIGGCFGEDKDSTLRIDCSMLTAIEDSREVIGKELSDNLR